MKKFFLGLKRGALKSKPGIFNAVIVLLLCLAIGTIGSPVLQSASAWMDTSLSPGERANLLLAQMTLDEKITMVHGGGTSSYVGHVMANTRLGIPELNMSDGPAGVANGKTQVTAFPAPICAAATWDVDLVRNYGAAMGAEQRGKGANVQLAPMMNMDRVPNAGRNWEGYGEDPYHSAQLAAAEVIGIQSNGIIATAKHYIDNDQETNRGSVSASIDDRTQHEIYLPPFKACVKAGVGAVMGAYNKVNGTYACENSQILTTILKGELGFSGWVMSDWGATHSTVAAANAGFDQEMPGSGYFGDALKNAVNGGQVPMSRLDDMVRRILTSMFAAGLFDRAPDGNVNNNVQSAAHTQIAKDVATQGLVLLKNTNNLLPLNTSNIKSIAVIGSAASTSPIVVGGGSGNVNVPYVVTPLQGITNRAGTGISVKYAAGDSNNGTAVPSQYLKTPSGAAGLQGQYFNNTTMTGTPVLTRTDANVDFNWNNGSPGTGVNATNWSTRWTGTLIPPTTGTYSLVLSSDDGSRLYVNGTLKIDNWGDHGEQSVSTAMALTAGQAYTIEIDYYQGGGSDACHFRWIMPGDSAFSQSTTLASQSDVAIVVVGMASSEGSDRSNLNLPGVQDSLISAVAQVNPRTIVLVYAPAQILMPWESQVAAIMYGWVPGQEEGNAFASIVFGDVNPSGRLPMTFAQNLSDYPCNTTQQFPGVNGVVTYSEGLLIGYRHFDAKNITPLFPFGHGLSYTTFGYGNLGISPATVAVNGNVTVTANISNTGSKAGAEVTQLYLGFPTAAGEPPKQLKGFKKVLLQPGQSQTVTFTLTPEELSIWDTAAKKWVVTQGTYQVMVGASSRDIRLTGSFTVGSGINTPTPTPTGGPTVTPTSTPTATPTPTVNPGKVLPGKIEAESYNAMSGVATEATTDTGGGLNVGWIDLNDWMDYTVNVQNSGSYKIDYRVASPNTTAKVDFRVNGATLATTTIPNTGGWQAWTTVSANLSLSVGSQTIRLFASGGGWNINWFQGSSGGVTSTPTPTPTIGPTNTPTPTPTVNPGGILLSQGKSATASSFQAGNEVAKGNDGNLTTRWAAGDGTFPQWWKVDLGMNYTLSRVDINWYNTTTRSYKYKIEVSSDNVTFSTVVDKTGNTAMKDTSDNFTATARYVRITVTGASAGWASAFEFKVYGN